jgi:hypothetical protein
MFMSHKKCKKNQNIKVNNPLNIFIYTYLGMTHKIKTAFMKNQKQIKFSKFLPLFGKE